MISSADILADRLENDGRMLTVFSPATPLRDSRKKNRNGALKAMQMRPRGHTRMLRPKQTLTSKLAVF